jgi:hypothetical protein
MSVQITGAQIKNDAIDNSKIADDAVQAAQIQANAVVAAKIASGAITEAKLGASAVSTAKIANSAVTSAKMDLSGTFDFSSGTLQAGTPSNASDVTNKSYVDGLVGSGVYWKEPARAASTANVNISNPGEFYLRTSLVRQNAGYMISTVLLLLLQDRQMQIQQTN